MKQTAKLATLFATGSLFLAGAPAFAASAATDAFVANVRPNVDFLNSSSRLALDKSTAPRLRAFARREATDQTITGNSLVAWAETNTPSGEAVALGAPVVGPLAPIGTVVAAPLDVATGVTAGVVNGVGDVLTGRSVALDPPLAPVPAPAVAPIGTGLLPSQQTDMSRLQGLDGHGFAALYRSTQSDALHQLAGLYRDYLASGDDPALRAIAARELPKINRWIAELPRI